VDGGTRVKEDKKYRLQDEKLKLQEMKKKLKEEKESRRRGRGEEEIGRIIMTWHDDRGNNVDTG